MAVAPKAGAETSGKVRDCETQRDAVRQRERHTHRERESVCVCVCV